MKETTNFFDRHKPTFEEVCNLLGNNWRINLLDNCQYRIKLTSPDFRKFSIIVIPKNQRLELIGSVDTWLYRGSYFNCTVAPDRKPLAIARAIERKILQFSRDEISKAQDAENSYLEAQEHDAIVKGMLTRLVSLSNHHNAFTGFKAENGLEGSIKKGLNDYGLSVNGLTLEQLVKITGMLKTI